MKLILLLTGLFLNLSICILLLANNPKKHINRYVASAALALAFWEITNYLADTSGALTLFWNRVTFIAPMLILLFSDLSIVKLSNSQAKSKPYRFMFIVSVFFGLIALTSLIVPSIRPRLDQAHVVGYNPNYGPAYPIISFWFLILIGHLVRSLYKAWQKSRGRMRLQLNIVLVGLSIALVGAVISNLVLPNIVGNSASSQYAPLASVAFMGAMAIAILKHGLFDIRLIVARAIAYLLSLVSLGALFVLITLIVANLFSAKTLSEIRIIYTALALVLGLLFPTIKLAFDKVTKKVFYRDLYDPQVFLDQLNQTIIDNIELGILLRHTAKVIEENFKCEQVTFIISDESSREIRSINSSGNIDNFRNLKSLRTEITKFGKKLIVYDELDNSHTSVKDLFKDNKLNIIAVLQSGEVPEDDAKAYLCLGPKKSGNIFSNKDLKLLEIIANELDIAIQNALRFEEIQNFNITLQKRINEATSKLRKANERLKIIDETKDDFISMASHQLRTPLTSIKGYISMLLEGDAGKLNATQNGMLSQAFVSSQRMVYLIADMLNVSRLKTGKFIIETTPVNLAEMVEQEMGQLKETANAHSLKLVFNRPRDFPLLNLDETKIRQVIMNFSDNAIYYTPSGGRIEVELINNPQTVEFRVKDNGIGVPNSEKHHLFTKFYRAGNARKARPDGTGLGLYMAQKVIIAQGGALIFESQEGKGSTFGFTFSKAKLQVLENQPKPLVASAV